MGGRTTDRHRGHRAWLELSLPAACAIMRHGRLGNDELLAWTVRVQVGRFAAACLLCVVGLLDFFLMFYVYRL